MVKQILKSLMLKSPAFRASLANHRKRQREFRIQKNRAVYFASSETIRTEPKRGW